MKHDSIKFCEWVPFEETIEALRERMMVNGSLWILDEWKAKYINARIDMRTGQIRLTFGNALGEGTAHE